MKYIWLLLCWLMVLSSIAQAQQSTSWQGKLIDGQTNEPLPFVTVFVASRRGGTVANANGQFILRIPNSTTADTVAFSSVGYETYRVPLLKLAIEGVVPLKRSLVMLNEVTVRAINAKELIREAIQNIPKNYPHRPVLMQGFYREWMKERLYLIFSEGLLELYKASYNTKHSDEVRMLKGRRKPLVSYIICGNDTCQIPILTNGSFLGVLLDVVKKSGQNTFLTEDGLNQYEYTYTGATTLYNRTIYIVNFKPLFEAHNAFFAGKLFIDQRTKAVARAEYQLSAEGLGMVASELSIKRVPMELVQRQYKVEYRLESNQWYLQHAYAYNKYQYTARNLAPITSEMNFIVTKISSQDVKHIKRSEQLRMDDAFVEKVTNFDDSFWGNENSMAEER